MLFACVNEVLLIILGVCVELIAHRMFVLGIAAVYAVLLLMAIFVARRMGRI
jgi:MFS-type transporter involved in bile tolerance (Atg22 family)